MCTKNELQVITKRIIEEAFNLLADKIYKIILYGSYARGDFTPESDVDVIILLNCSKDEVRLYRKQISRLSSRISIQNDVEISILLRDRASYEEGMKVLPFYRNINQEGIILYE